MELDELRRQIDALDSRCHRSLKEALTARYAGPVSDERGTRDESEAAMPYINAAGTLVIPFSSARKYHWWSGGQSVLDTLLELGADDGVIRRYVGGSHVRKEGSSERN